MPIGFKRRGRQRRARRNVNPAKGRTVLLEADRTSIEYLIDEINAGRDYRPTINRFAFSDLSPAQIRGKIDELFPDKGKRTLQVKEILGLLSRY